MCLKSLKIHLENAWKVLKSLEKTLTYLTWPLIDSNILKLHTNYIQKLKLLNAFAERLLKERCGRRLNLNLVIGSSLSIYCVWLIIWSLESCSKRLLLHFCPMSHLIHFQPFLSPHLESFLNVLIYISIKEPWKQLLDEDCILPAQLPSPFL